MLHVTSLEEAGLTSGSVVTIGSFDGVHLGHQLLIDALVTHAQVHNLTPIVLTFYPHPSMVIGGFEPGYYLMLPDEKAAILGELGVEVVVTHPFNNAVRHIQAEAFVNRLITYLSMKALWVGENFAMGYQREGNARYLASAAIRLGFDFKVVDLMDSDGTQLSSTRIRAAVWEGRVADAQELLGRPYRIEGKVVRGAERGRTIGFPTANLEVSPDKAIPAKGVYAGWARLDSGKVYPTVVNIGVRPTFAETVVQTIEAHLIDFEGDIYSQTLRLDFVERLRDEMKFGGVDQLVAQIHFDVDKGLTLLKARNPG